MRTSPIVLLGAGASRDAGLPLAWELSRAIFASSDLYRPRPGYDRPAAARALVERIHQTDPSTVDNYELFFRRLDEIDELFPSLGPPGIRARPDEINEGMALLFMNAPSALANLLSKWPIGDVSYLARIAELGWERSLRWYSRKGGREIVEVPPGHAPQDFGAATPSKPDMILGPLKRLEDDEPYRTLYQAFLRALDQAAACVVIGFGYTDGDEHIARLLVRAATRGTIVLDVCPPMRGGNPADRLGFHAVRLGARQALECGEILRQLGGLIPRT